MAIPKFRDQVRMIRRALLLRCPHCGSKGIMATWFRLADRCPRCKLNTNREEGDYFLGAYVIMLIAIELLFAFLFLVVLIVTWPNPPWEAIQWVGAIVLSAGAIIAYPFAKTLFLAIDLIFRPVNASELGWYEDEGDG
ncbi:MAG TPA: DUF983 domain-containing protein [Gemmatimonadaceae bacterium]